MTNTRTEALQRAIDYLGAVEVAPGRIAVPEKGRWFILTPHDVCIIAEDRREVFTGGSVRMPAWWSPDRQTAYRIVNGDGSYSSERFSNESEAGRLAFGEQLQRITCDLATGEEMPC